MKKGFTLVELLAVIVIVATISLLIVPAVTSILNTSKQNLSDVQKKDILTSAKKWALDNFNELDVYHLNDVYLPLSYLQDSGYFEKDAVMDPKTKQYLNGCIRISYNDPTNQYKYTYIK